MLYHLTCIVALFAVGTAHFHHNHGDPSGHHGGHCGHGPHDPHVPHGPYGPNGDLDGFHRRVFEEIVDQMVEVDRDLQRFCGMHSNGATVETVLNGQYILSTPISDFKVTDVTVKIKNKVLFVNAVNGSSKRYSEIRIIPGIVNAAEARFDLVDGTLKIVFPFRQPATNSCTAPIDTNEITVPHADLKSVIPSLTNY